MNNHLLCYWPTIHNLILNICSKFQVLSSHFFEVYELLVSARWVLNKIVQWKYFNSNLCWMRINYAISCIDQKFVFRNSRIWCLARLALIFIWNNHESENANLVLQKIICRWRNTTSQILFCSVQLIRTYGLVVKVGRRKLGDMSSTPDKCWKSLLSLCHFCVALSPSVHWHKRFNIAVLSIVFSFLDFVSGDLALTEL